VVIPALGAVPEPSPACEALIARTAAAIEPRVPAISAQMIDRVLAEIAELDAADEELVDDLRAAARGSVALITAMARTWTDPRVVPPPHDAVVWARGLVGRGLAIDVLLRVYRLGQAGYHEVWQRELAAADVPRELLLEAIAAITAFTFTWVDAISKPLVEAYEDERERRLQGAAAVRADTVRALLAGEAVDPGQASARLGYALARPHVAVIAWVEGGGGAGDGALAAVIAQAAEALRAEGRPLVVHPGPDEAAGWLGRPAADGAPKRLRAALQARGVRLAIGERAEGIAGFRASHDQAQRARRVARLLRRGAAVTRYADVAVADLLSRDLPAARAMARTTLGPLAGDDDTARRLLSTLRVFAEEGQSYARAGRRLGLHPNTVAYRVQRALALTGGGEVVSDALAAAVTLAPLLDD
jgi:hypothetical protein